MARILPSGENNAHERKAGVPDDDSGIFENEGIEDNESFKAKIMKLPFSVKTRCSLLGEKDMDGSTAIWHAP